MDYYRRSLKEATQKLRGDVGDNAVSVELNKNPFEFKNPRPESVLGYERDNYEFLCRESYKVWSQFFLSSKQNISFSVFFLPVTTKSFKKLKMSLCKSCTSIIYRTC